MSKAGYYAWRSRKKSDRCKADEKLLNEIKRLHRKSHAEFGRPRIHLDLIEAGFNISGKRIARLMRYAGIKGVRRNRSKASSAAPGSLPAAPNILNRQFTVPKPNTVWVTDITYFPTKQGTLYLAVVLDCYSRRVVGWSTDHHNDAALALAALKMALRKRPYHKLLLHSDRGSQFTSHEYSRFLKFCDITASMSRKGNCWDNAVAESFFATLKIGLNSDRVWTTRAEVRAAINDYIEIWYNSQRRHSAIGYLSPIAFENRRVT